jgi:DNA-binding response OmpR family regulator
MYAVIVDDEPDDLKKVTDCLPSCQFTRVEPLSTTAQLNALLVDVAAGNREEPALILLDLKIGDDGEAGLKMLRQVREAIPHMPVIIVSGTKFQDMVITCFAAGACSYIHKSERQGQYEHRIGEMFNYFSGISKIPAVPMTG